MARAQMKMRIVALVGIAVGLVVGIGTARAGFDPSDVIFPAQKLPIKFSHKLHTGAVLPASGKKIKAACTECHEGAKESLVSSDNLVPHADPKDADKKHDACSGCHPIDDDDPEKQVAEGKAPARCDSCHVAADAKTPPPIEIPDPHIKFNHKIHVDRDIACAECHGTMEKVDVATREGLPRMPLCLKCHNQVATKDRAPAKCGTCHRTGPDGLLVTDFPSGQLVPSGTLKADRHTPDFATRHGAVAREDEKYCLNCHRRDYCLSCHNGVVKPASFHGNDYLRIHGIDARKASMKCEGCHRRQTFCLGCHERSGVVDKNTVDAPNSYGNANPTRRFHPPYEKWVSSPKTPDHHAWQAERNVKACIACHREETCLECHSASANVKGLPETRRFSNISPHPPGFAGSRECSTIAAKNGRVCLKCHAPNDMALSCK